MSTKNNKKEQKQPYVNDTDLIKFEDDKSISFPITNFNKEFLPESHVDMQSKVVQNLERVLGALSHIFHEANKQKAILTDENIVSIISTMTNPNEYPDVAQLLLTVGKTNELHFEKMLCDTTIEDIESKNTTFNLTDGALSDIIHTADKSFAIFGFMADSKYITRAEIQKDSYPAKCFIVGSRELLVDCVKRALETDPTAASIIKDAFLRLIE